MGLDITAYYGLELAVEATVDEDGEYGDGIVVFYEGYPGRQDAIQYEVPYTAKDSMQFRAGSYSGYNWWREQLAILAGWPAHPEETEERKHSRSTWKATEGPFWELINFSDCDGVIGPVTSAKLAKDFAEYQAKVDVDNGDTYFINQYANWRKAFEMAANNGAVRFH